MADIIERASTLRRLMPTTSIAIKVKVQELIKTLREYSCSQRELWQKVPYLALEADGHSGYSEDLERAYRHGMWAIRSSEKGGDCRVYVDCATGVLVSASEFSSHGRIKPANDFQVFSVLYHSDEVDVQKIIDDLARQAKARRFGTYDPDEQEEWREMTRKSLKLGELYVRHGI